MKKKIILIFGSGVNLSIGLDKENTPPLDRDLFNELEEKFDSWKQIPEEFKLKCRVSFENGFTEYMNCEQEIYSHKYIKENLPPIKTTNFPLRLLLDLARFFLGFQPKEKTTFNTLIQKYKGALKSDIEVFSTNYDTIFDLSLYNEGVKTNIFPETSINSFGYYKLHGGCNIAIASGFKVGKDQEIGVAIGTNFKGRISFIYPYQNQDYQLLDYNYKQFSALPLMCWYNEIKTKAVNGEFIEKTKFKLKTEIGNAELVIIIGLNFNILDKHIWNPILNSRSEIIYIGGKETCDFFEKYDNIRVFNHREHNNYWEEIVFPILDKNLNFKKY